MVSYQQYFSCSLNSQEERQVVLLERDRFVKDFFLLVLPVIACDLTQKKGPV